MAELVDFHDVALDAYISLGATVKIKFQTVVLRMRAGHEERIGEWQDPLRQFDIAPALIAQADLTLLVAFFRARRGQKYAFRFRDPTDYEATAMPFGIGDGATTVFQLSKSYNSGLAGDSTYYIRPIMLPDAGIAIYNNAVLQTSGVSVNFVTGAVTYTAAPANGVSLTWTGAFTLPVRFLNDNMYPSIETYQRYEVSLPLIEQRSLINGKLLTEVASPDFVETRFLPIYASTSTIGQNFGAIVIPSASGHESRISQFAELKSQFEVEQTNQALVNLPSLLAFFLSRKGRLYGFRLKDILDYTLTSQVIGVGDAVKTVFQIVKTYTSGGYTQTRTITKPLAGLVVYLDGLAADPQPSVSLTTGLITFASPVGLDVVVSCAGEFDVPVRFESDELSLTINGFDSFNLNRMGFVEIPIDLPVVTVDTPSLIPVAVVSGCGVVPIPDRAAVRKYVSFTSGKLDFGTVLNRPLFSILTRASSCTVAFLVSHVGVDSSQTLFYHNAPTEIPGFQFDIGTWGRSATAFSSVGGYKLTPGFVAGGFVATTMNFNPQQANFKPKGILGADDSLRAYVCTMDWGSKRLYCSGTCFGSKTLSISAPGTDLFTYDFYPLDTPQFPTIEECQDSIVSSPTSAYVADPDGRWGSNFAVNSGNLGARGPYPSPGQGATPFSGRMYEAFLLVGYIPFANPADAMDYLANTQIERSIVNTQHKPILRYWLSKYGSGYPLIKAPSITAALGAWWRADEGIEVDETTQHIMTWAPFYSSGASESEFTWKQNYPIETGGLPALADVPILGLPVFPGNLYYSNGKKIV